MGISTALMTTHNDDMHVTSAKRNGLNGVAGLDADGQLADQNFPSRVFKPVWKAYFSKLTTVAGLGPLKSVEPLQTEYDVSLTGVPGLCLAGIDNLDEVKEANLLLLAGTYRLDIAFEGATSRGILEILYGTTSLGTWDTYRAVLTSNLIATVNFTLAVDTTANFRIRSNGKNGASSGYNIFISYVRLTPLVGSAARYNSGNQTITSGGTLTLAHGLGVAPYTIQGRLKCLTAEFGYSINDITIVNLTPDQDAVTNNFGISCTYDATNIYIKFGASASALFVLGKTDGIVRGITNANWALIISAGA